MLSPTLPTFMYPHIHVHCKQSSVENLTNFHPLDSLWWRIAWAVQGWNSTSPMWYPREHRFPCFTINFTRWTPYWYQCQRTVIVIFRVKPEMKIQENKRECGCFKRLYISNNFLAMGFCDYLPFYLSCLLLTHIHLHHVIVSQFVCVSALLCLQM